VLPIKLANKVLYIYIYPIEITKFRQVNKRNIHSDWAHSRPAASVRNTKCFMQVQVRYIGAVFAWSTHANLRVRPRTDCSLTANTCVENS